MLAANIKTVKSKYGKVSYYSDDQYIGDNLERYGEYSEIEVALWRKIVQPGWTVIDGGANIGTTALALASMVGESGRVIAFEPQSENYELLARNIEQNKKLYGTTIEPHQRVLGAESGEVKIQTLGELYLADGHTNYGGVSPGRGSGLAQITTIDAVLGDKPVHFIKLDVEGWEEPALHGARKTIEVNRPILYLENHPDRGAATTNGMISLVRGLGYRCFEHKPPLFNPDNFNGCKDDATDGIISMNALCIPKEIIGDYNHVTDGMVPLIPEAPSLGKNKWACIVRLGGIGDNLIASSVLRPLKSRGYNVEVITQHPQSVVFENNPFVDKLTVKKKEDLPQEDGMAWQDYFQARAREYDLFANLSHTCEMSLASFRAMTSFYWRSDYRRKIHGANYLETVCDIVGVPYEFGPLFFPTEEEKEQALRTKRMLGKGPIIGWCLAGTRPDKIYPQTPVVIARLLREVGQVVMLGGPPPLKDHIMAEEVQGHVKVQNGSDKGLHLAMSVDAKKPGWPIRRLLTMAGVCDLVIGPDTGPLWAVAFEQMPKILLHSHASVNNITKHWKNTVSMHPDQSRVPCWPCHLLHDTPKSCEDEQERCGMTLDPEAKGAACISSLPVHQIVETATKLLGGAN